MVSSLVLLTLFSFLAILFANPSNLCAEHPSGSCGEFVVIPSVVESIEFDCGNITELAVLDAELFVLIEDNVDTKLGRSPDDAMGASFHELSVLVPPTTAPATFRRSSEKSTSPVGYPFGVGFWAVTDDEVAPRDRVALIRVWRSSCWVLCKC